jgi:hypothetical protein
MQKMGIYTVRLPLATDRAGDVTCVATHACFEMELAFLPFIFRAALGFAHNPSRVVGCPHIVTMIKKPFEKVKFEIF